MERNDFHKIYLLGLPSRFGRCGTRTWQKYLPIFKKCFLFILRINFGGNCCVIWQSWIKIIVYFWFYWFAKKQFFFCLKVFCKAFLYLGTVWFCKFFVKSLFAQKLLIECWWNWNLATDQIEICCIFYISMPDDQCRKHGKIDFLPLKLTIDILQCANCWYLISKGSRVVRKKDIDVTK